MPYNPGDDTPGAVWSASPHANRRSVPRYRFMARAIVTELSSGTRLPARTSELGLNGCYIDTLELFPVGALVHLRIQGQRRVRDFGQGALLPSGDWHGDCLRGLDARPA